MKGDTKDVATVVAEARSFLDDVLHRAVKLERPGISLAAEAERLLGDAEHDTGPEGTSRAFFRLGAAWAHVRALAMLTDDEDVCVRATTVARSMLGVVSGSFLDFGGTSSGGEA